MMVLSFAATWIAWVVIMDCIIVSAYWFYYVATAERN